MQPVGDHQASFNPSCETDAALNFPTRFEGTFVGCHKCRVAPLGEAGYECPKLGGSLGTVITVCVRSRLCSRSLDGARNWSSGEHQNKQVRF